VLSTSGATGIDAIGRLIGRLQTTLSRFTRGETPLPASPFRPDRLHLVFDRVKAQDRLLLFISFDHPPEGVDRVRIQKGMFLFAQEAAVADGEKYQFVPYSYGPMSTQIYRDLELLVDRELIEERPVEGQSWVRYEATEKGLHRSRELLAGESSEAAQQLCRIKREVVSKTFSALLEDVYERYPEYAVNSIFRRAS
jgi:uncharacterized protein